MKRYELLDLIQDIQLNNYNTFEAELHTREDIADLIIKLQKDNVKIENE